MATIRITVDGRLALTTGQLADEFGLTPAGMRTILGRLGVDAVAKLDDRTPLYPAVETRKALRERPGRGRSKRAVAPGR